MVKRFMPNVTRAIARRTNVGQRVAGFTQGEEELVDEMGWDFVVKYL